jgi:hypothetical protein
VGAGPANGTPTAVPLVLRGGCPYAGGTVGFSGRTKVLQYNQMTEAKVQEVSSIPWAKIAFVPHLNVMVSGTSSVSNADINSTDDLHPTNEGQDTLTDNYWEYIRWWQGLGQKAGNLYFTPITTASVTDLGLVNTENVKLSGGTGVTSFGTSQHLRRFIQWGADTAVTHGSSTIKLINSTSRTIKSGSWSLFISDGAGVWQEVWTFGPTGAVVAELSDLVMSFSAIEAKLAVTGAFSGQDFALFGKVGGSNYLRLGLGDGSLINDKGVGAFGQAPPGSQPSLTANVSAISDANAKAFAQQVASVLDGCGLAADSTT